MVASKTGLNQIGTTSKIVEKTSIPVVSNDTDGIVIKIHANQNQMNQICDFMKAISEDYYEDEEDE